MWPGPYGNWGSRKYLMASLDQSLRRMNLDYVDIFYIHRFDPRPVEETLQALVDIVLRQSPLRRHIPLASSQATKLDNILTAATHCLLFQDRLNMLDRSLVYSESLKKLSRRAVRIHRILLPLPLDCSQNRYSRGQPKLTSAQDDF